LFRGLTALLAVLLMLPARAAESFDIGLAADGRRIDAFAISATADGARSVVLVGGLSGEDASSDRVRAALTTYEAQGERPFHLVAVPVVNPAASTLRFPPDGVAYADLPESHALWRWLGSHAPDLVLVEVSPNNSPLSYANAFLKPVRAQSGRSLIEESALSLRDYSSKLREVYDLESQLAYFTTLDGLDWPNAIRHTSRKAVLQWLPVPIGA